jgi:hypothetical protein
MIQEMTTSPIKKLLSFWRSMISETSTVSTVEGKALRYQSRQ